MARSQALKILVISHEYPPIGGGGGKVIQDLCEGLISDGISFYLLTAHWGDLAEIESRKSLTIERLRSCRKEAYRANLLAMGCFVWKSFWRALRIIKIWQPDLIHAHFAVPGGASAALAGLITKTPYILTIHGGDVPGGAPEKTGKWFKFIQPFTGFIWKNASKIITVSQYSRKLAQTHYQVEIEVIPNGIDIKTYKNSSNDVHDPPQLLFIGRFSPEKNPTAVPIILSRIKDGNWKCKMIGNGPQLDEVKELINRLELEERITLTGWQSQEDVTTALLSSDILVMPSLREGMPMAGLQALAAGNALVLSNVGDCSDMVDLEENGYLIKPDNIDGFSKAIKELIASPRKLKAYKKHSKHKAAQFDLQQILDQYKDIFAKVLEENI